MCKISFYVSIPFKGYFLQKKKEYYNVRGEISYKEMYFKIWSKIPKSS